MSFRDRFDSADEMLDTVHFDVASKGKTGMISELDFDRVVCLYEGSNSRINTAAVKYFNLEGYRRGELAFIRDPNAEGDAEEGDQSIALILSPDRGQIVGQIPGITNEDVFNVSNSDECDVGLQFANQGVIDEYGLKPPVYFRVDEDFSEDALAEIQVAMGLRALQLTVGKMGK